MVKGSASKRPYRQLAEYYDRLLATESLLAIQEKARSVILGKILLQIKSACDLACGTGTTAVCLAQKGISTCALDLSPSMCRLARDKVRRARVTVHVMQADMRHFELPEPVDLVLCEADAINHVTRKSDLADIVRSVARALRPGGCFYFETNNRAGFRQYWKDIWWTEKPGVVMVMRNGNDADNDRAWCDVEWFRHTGQRNWRRQRERVEEVCWSDGEIRTTLKDMGFISIRTWDAAPFYNNDWIKPGCRSFYLARK